MTCWQMRGGVMDRLDLRLFNINYSVFTDVDAAYRQLQLAFTVKPHSPTGLPRSLTLKQHSSDTTRYSLWYEDAWQCDFSDLHAAVRQLEHSLLQRAIREDFGLTIFHAAADSGWVLTKRPPCTTGAVFYCRFTATFC